MLRKEKELQKAIDENFGGHRLGRARYSNVWNFSKLFDSIQNIYFTFKNRPFRK